MESLTRKSQKKWIFFEGINYKNSFDMGTFFNQHTKEVLRKFYRFYEITLKSESSEII